MGWTSESNGLWEMNDAGWDHPRADRAAGLVSWFQVDAASPEPAMPLPVQPFLRCATEVTARAGALDLMTAQVLMPVGGLAPHARPRRGGVPSMRTARWFGEASPAARTRVHVTIDVGAGGVGHCAAIPPGECTAECYRCDSTYPPGYMTTDLQELT